MVLSRDCRVAVDVIKEVGVYTIFGVPYWGPKNINGSYYLGVYIQGVLRTEESY